MAERPPLNDYEEIFGLSSSDTSDEGYSGLSSTVSSYSSTDSDSGRGVYFDSSEEDPHNPYPQPEDSSDETDSDENMSDEDDDVPLDVLVNRLPNLRQPVDRLVFWRDQGIFDRLDANIGQAVAQGLAERDPVAEAFAADQHNGYDGDIEDFDHEWHI